MTTNIRKLRIGKFLKSDIGIDILDYMTDCSLFYYVKFIKNEGPKFNMKVIIRFTLVGVEEAIEHVTFGYYQNGLFKAFFTFTPADYE